MIDRSSTTIIISQLFIDPQMLHYGRLSDVTFCCYEHLLLWMKAGSLRYNSSAKYGM